MSRKSSSNNPPSPRGDTKKPPLGIPPPRPFTPPFDSAKDRIRLQRPSSNVSDDNSVNSVSSRVKKLNANVAADEKKKEEMEARAAAANDGGFIETDMTKVRAPIRIFPAAKH